MNNFHVDCETLPPGKLSKKYKTTYESWRNMKQRAKSSGAVIAPEFLSFAHFLQHVGPRPSATHTLDRLNNENPTYGPGLVAWRDKKAQANNKSTTVYLTDSDGTKRPLTEWAALTCQKADTLYKRKKKGWPDPQVIHGLDSTEPMSTLLDELPWPAEARIWWERHYSQDAAAGRIPEDETRLTYYYRVSKNQFQALVTECQERALEEPFPAELTKQHGIWDSFFKDARSKYEKKKQSDRLLNRSGGLGKHKEATLRRLMFSSETEG